MNDDIITVQDACSMLGVSRQRIHALGIPRKGAGYSADDIHRVHFGRRLAAGGRLIPAEYTLLLGSDMAQMHRVLTYNFGTDAHPALLPAEYRKEYLRIAARAVLKKAATSGWQPEGEIDGRPAGEVCLGMLNHLPDDMDQLESLMDDIAPLLKGTEPGRLDSGRLRVRILCVMHNLEAGL